MIPGALLRSPGIYLIAKENLRKPQLADRLMKGPCDQSSPQMGSLTPNEVSRIAQHVRKGEGRKEGEDGVNLLSMELWAAAKKASLAVPSASVRVPSQRPLAPSVMSVTSVANYKGDTFYSKLKIIFGLRYRCTIIKKKVFFASL